MLTPFLVKMRGLQLLLLAAMSVVCSSQTLQMQCSTNQRQAAVGMTNANIILAGIFPIRKSQTTECGDYDEDTMQLYEAARWSLEYINSKNLAGNGLKLGMQAWDNCKSAGRAVNDVLNFYPEDTSQLKFCNASNSVMTMGVLGPYTSWSSEEVARLLSVYPGSQISYGAADSKLSDKAVYPYFMRTAPSSGTYATNLLSLLRTLKWNHLVAIYSDDVYGTNSYNEFLKVTHNTEICVSQSVLVETADTVDLIQKRLAKIVQTKASVGLIFAPTGKANKIMDALNKRGDAGKLQWILNDLNIEEGNQNRYLRGALVVNPKSTTIDDFVTHWVTLDPNNPPPENPWYREWFMTKYNCKLSGNVPAKFKNLNTCFVEPVSKRRSTFIQNAYVEPVVMAMFAFARAMNSAHQIRCFGQQGLCQALLSMKAAEFHQNYLMKVDFNIAPVKNRNVKFDSNGDLENPEFRLWNYIYDSTIAKERFAEVGTSENDKWTLTPLTLYDENRNFNISNSLTSQCPTSGCPTCLVHYQRPYLNYIDGDILIGGLFSVHDNGRLPYACGPLNLQNIQAMAAFRFAIENLKNKFPNLLPKVSLGAVYSDVCQSSSLIESTLSGFLGEKQVFRDKITKKLIEPNRIQAYVSSLANKQSIVAADILGKFKYPEVEASATAIELSNRKMFPYFSRTAPGDAIQLMILINVLKRKDWTYVQVVSNNPHSAEVLKNYASSMSICVSAIHMIDETGNNYMQIVHGLKKNSHAKAVVVLSEPEQINMLLAAMTAQNATKEFVLLGTDSWGASTRAVANQEVAADGSLTLTTDTGTINEFKQYLDRLNPKSDTLLTEWYQKLHNCYLYAGAQGSYKVQCGSSPFTSSLKFILDDSVFYTINAVYAVALALNKTINNYCGVNQGSCAAFRASRYDSKSILLQSIRDITVQDANGMPFVIKNGEGQASQTINSYQKNSGYIKVGTYNVADSTLQLNPVSTMTSVCPGSCYECHTVSKKDFLYTRGKMLITAIMGIHSSSNPSFPLLCGEQVDGFQFVSAVEFAISSINNGQAPVRLNGINLGSLILDSCRLESRAFGLISAVYSGSYQIADKFQVKSIVAWMTDTSEAASQMGLMASKLKLPLVSPAATSEALMNKAKYSTFYRTIPGDETLTTTIAKLCRVMDFRYIQTIASDDQFSLESAMMLKNIGKQEGVCVIANYRLGTGTNVGDILKLVRQNGAPVVLFVSPTELEALLVAKKFPMDENLVFITPHIAEGVAKKYPAAAKNLLTTQIRSPDLRPYLSYMNSRRPDDVHFASGFFNDFYQETFKCDLPGRYRFGQNCPKPYRPITDAPRFSVAKSVHSTINGVYAIVDALHDTLTELCGFNYTGVCANFEASPNQKELFLKNLDKVYIPGSGVSGGFRFINREGSADYEILRFNGTKYEEVGVYDGVALKLNDISKHYKGVKTNFPNQYLSCQRQTLNFTLTPGDIYIAGIFDVHNQGLRPFSCGDIKMLRGFQNIEAFQFAIEEVNKKQGLFKNILPGINLGSIGLDSCSSDVRAGNLISNIYNGKIKLEKRGVTVNPDNIDAYIGGPTSDSSIYLSRILRSLMVPQVSYAATSDQLNNRDRYPYFLRTVPADDRLVEAMTTFLSKNDIRYVQVVHTTDNYGVRGSEAFNRIAVKKRICVAQTIQYSYKGTSTGDSANNIVSKLLENPLANTVVIFAQPSYINELLKAIAREPLAKQRKYKFVGASLWGKTWDAVRDIESIAVGSVTMAIQSKDIHEFNKYLEAKTLANHAQNPWFNEYYEKIFNCYLTEKRSDLLQQCSSTSDNVVSAREYIQDDSVLNVINGVYAIALALDETLKQMCGVNYTSICGAFKGQQIRGDYLLKNLKNVNFKDMSSKSFGFTDRGDSNKGYTFYQLQNAQPAGYRYEEIATANSYGILNYKAAITNWNASCNRLGACSECAILRNPFNRFMVWPPVKASSVKPAIVGIFDVHFMGQNTFQCGHLDVHGDVINMLAFFYAIDLTKNKTSILGIALDTCGHSLQADQDVYGILKSGALCHDNRFAEQVTAKAGNVYSFLTMHDANTIAANRVLHPQKIAYLSPDAMSSRLADNAFDFLYRTTGSQSQRIKVLVNLLKNKDIQSTVVLYSSTADYTAQLTTFLKYMKTEKLCVEQTVPVKDSVAMGTTLGTLASRKGLKVILLLTSQSDAVKALSTMKAAAVSPEAREYVILGVEDWMPRMVDQFVSVAKLVLTVTPRFAEVPGFADFVKRLQYGNQMNMPKGWFDEFYQRIHKCRLPGYPAQANVKTCTQLETISDGMLNLKTPVVLKTILGTLALADAIQEMRIQCGSSQDAKCQLEKPEGRKNFNIILNKVAFDISNKLKTNPKLGSFYFTDRIWEPDYVLQELRSSNGNYEFQDTTPAQMLKSIDNEDVKILAATCNGCTCVNGVQMAKSGTAERSVSWMYLDNFGSNIRNYYYYKDGKKLYDWPLWAIIVAALTAIGIFVTVFLFFYLLIAYPIRGGTTPLGFIFMIGIIGIYGVNFAFFLPASMVTCAARRFCMGVVYAICFACLLVKAVDNWRSSDSIYNNKKYKRLTSSLSLVLITIGIILMQVVIPVEWLLAVRPGSINLNPNPEVTPLHDYSWCTPIGSYDSGLALSFIFILILDLITILFGALAWDNEKNCFECRWIVIASLCTSGCFLVWMIVSTVANPVFRDPAVAIGNFINATALLILIPLRKVILLINAKRTESKDRVDMTNMDDQYSRPISYLEPSYIEKSNW